MGVAILIDACDGFIARLVRVDVVVPRLDGQLLDNLVDYVNYAMVPAFFLVCSGVLPASARMPLAVLVVLTSAYQFAQTMAKTPDHFFTGFPSYWNIVVFYLFVLPFAPVWNAAFVLAFCGLVFVPVKYIYPTRLEHLSERRWMLRTVRVSTAAWGLSAFALLSLYPRRSALLTAVSLGFVVLYFAASVYRTLAPLRTRSSA